MNDAFYIGATGLQAHQHALDVIANNVANINTGAFKRAGVRFSEIVAPPPERIDTIVPPPSGGLSGVFTQPMPRVMDQGPLRVTGKPLDLAIDGNGMIELLGPEGRLLLWRGGTLTVNADGYLSAENGLPLKAMISVPEQASGLQIDRAGRVFATVSGDADPVELGQIELVQIRGGDALTSAGDGLFALADDAQAAAGIAGEDGRGALVQGALEGSNVDLTTEIVSLLLMQRAYAASAQVVQAGDQLMGIANGLRR